MADTKTGQLARGNCAGTGVTTRGPEGGAAAASSQQDPLQPAGAGPTGQWRRSSSSSLSRRQVLNLDGQRPPRDPRDRVQGSERVGSVLPGDRQAVRDEVGVGGVGARGEAPQELDVGELRRAPGTRPLRGVPPGRASARSATAAVPAAAGRDRGPPPRSQDPRSPRRRTRQPRRCPPGTASVRLSPPPGRQRTPPR